MPIANTDIALRLSGGAANSNPAVSLGGAKSSVAAPAALFDTVNGTEAAAGDTEFRCIYVHNNHATLAMANAVLWLTANTPSTNTNVSAGLGSSAVNAVEQTVASESAAPAGVTFSAAADKANGIALGSIPAGQSRAVWLRRDVTAGAAAIASDAFTVRVECEAGA